LKHNCYKHLSFISTFVSCILLFYIIITNQKLSGFSCIGVFLQRHKYSLVFGQLKNTRMASTVQSQSLKRRDAPVTREGGDQLTLTPLGAGNEVGRSCVYMSFKGKTVLVLLPSLLPSMHFVVFQLCHFILITIGNS